MKKLNLFILFTLLIIGFAAPKNAVADEKPIEEMTVGEAHKMYKKLLFEHKGAFKALPYAKYVYEKLKTKSVKSKSRLAATKNYGSLLLRLDRQDEAKPIFREALSLYEAQYGEDAKELVDPLIELGHAMVRFEGRSVGTKYYKRAKEIAAKHYGENSIMLALLRIEMVEHRAINGIDKKTARRLKKELLAIQDVLKIADKDGQRPDLLARTQFRLGEVQMILGKEKQAAAELENAAVFFDKYMPKATISYNIHKTLVGLYEELGNEEMVEKHCRSAGILDDINGHRKGGLDYKPLLLKNPKYPTRALSDGRQGIVLVSLTVDINGKPSDVQVVSVKGGEDFAKEAVKAAQKFRYAVYHKDGEAKPIEDVRYLFKFNLAN